MRQPQPHRHKTSSSSRSRSAGLFAGRYAIGGVVVLTAVVVLIVVPGGLSFVSALAYGCGAALGAAVIMMLLNLLYRLSVGVEHERERAQEARRRRDRAGVSSDDEEAQSRQSTRRPGRR